ncbi:H3 protein, partial [Alcedo cyanopectus]|nr:H3 protein [Ceyx cyanopectus]
LKKPRAPRKKPRSPRKKPRELLPAAPFQRLVRSFAHQRGGFGVEGVAVAALREACEAQLLALLEVWGLCALHAKRAAVRAADIQLVRCLRGNRP